MCFSAEASFGAGAVLAAIGVVAVKKSSSVSSLPFALIPLLFAVQQLAEGLIWLSLQGVLSPAWGAPSILFFLVFAQVVWPAWVPLSMFLLETRRPERKTLAVLLVAGVTLAIYHIYGLAVSPVSASISGHHIAYNLHFPSLAGSFPSVLYFLVTVVPPFIPKLPRMRLLAFSLLFSFLVTVLFYQVYLISVWCFFAALISVTVLMVMHARPALPVPKTVGQ